MGTAVVLGFFALIYGLAKLLVRYLESRKFQGGEKNESVGSDRSSSM